MKSLFKYAIPLSALVLLATGSVPAKPRVIDRTSEKEKFPDLQTTEAKQEKNIKDTYLQLAKFGHLVELSKEDRAKKFAEVKDPYDFRNTLRNLKYTPRRSYVRYVESSPEFILFEMGELKEIQAMIEEKTKEANAAGVEIKPYEIPNLNGIELTQFDFIKEDVKQKCCVPVGAKIKSLTLFYRQANAGTDSEQETELVFTVTKLVEDHLKDGVRKVEIIIDPSPMDDDLNDILILHRYNKKVPSVMILGTLANTPNYPLRLEFKQKFYSQLVDHFYRLYQLVDGYANKDSNAHHEEVIDQMKRSLSY